MKIVVFGETLRNEVIDSLTCDKRISIVDDIDSADLLLSLGGDGTLLNTLPVIGSREIPVLGVNLGRLGFLTGATRNDISSLAAMLLNGEFSTVRRSVLEVCYSESNVQSSNEIHYALNEVAILRDENSSTIPVDVFVNNLLLNNYRGDGIIFATPTGSTAYSLSCGGPVLPPEADNIVVTPVASHTLTVRPLVLTGNSVLHAKCSVACKLTLDARNFFLSTGAVITIKRAPFSFITMKLRGKEFFETLREKLSWGV
ncbi:MAG: NAD(+)/NADH kinase [Bacteroidales bacterium]|jgi:NAD+ kinase|nr:NAD(+)/NADH kinase [Bacteroidales bacterium]